jgi:hypothetical protein
VGEEVAAAYLEYVKGCEFVQKNLYTPDVQGEIDVVGIDLNTKTVYICEVVVHLVTGMMYVNQKNNQTNNVSKLVEKFNKDIEYANKYLHDYKKVFMLWSPIVKSAVRSKSSSQMEDVLEVRRQLKEKYGVELETIINERFYQCLQEMRTFARKESKEIKNPILRIIQIEEYLMKHLQITQ